MLAYVDMLNHRKYFMYHIYLLLFCSVLSVCVSTIPVETVVRDAALCSTRSPGRRDRLDSLEITHVKVNNYFLCLCLSVNKRQGYVLKSKLKRKILCRTHVTKPAFV